MYARILLISFSCGNVKIAKTSSNLEAIATNTTEAFIDKGNEVLMLENFRIANIWNQFKQNPFVKMGISKANFKKLN